MTRIARVRIGLMALMVAATCFLAVATTALAQPGDSVENATYLNDYLASSLTTGLVPATFGTGSYYFKVLLSSGSALHADFASGAGVNGLKAILIDQSSSKTDFVESVVVSPSLCRLTFTAPAKGMYTIYVPSNTLGTFTVSPTVSSAPVVTPGTLSGTVSYSGGALSGATASVAGYAAATTASNGTYPLPGNERDDRQRCDNDQERHARCAHRSGDPSRRLPLPEYDHVWHLPLDQRRLRA